ncbi:MAG: hypothetical protein ACI9XZ_000419 [Alphaproteobacteria bacterium]
MQPPKPHNLNPREQSQRLRQYRPFPPGPIDNNHAPERHRAGREWHSQKFVSTPEALRDELKTARASAAYENSADRAVNGAPSSRPASPHHSIDQHAGAEVSTNLHNRVLSASVSLVHLHHHCQCVDRCAVLSGVA